MMTYITVATSPLLALCLKHRPVRELAPVLLFGMKTCILSNVVQYLDNNNVTKRIHVYHLGARWYMVIMCSWHDLVCLKCPI